MMADQYNAFVRPYSTGGLIKGNCERNERKWRVEVYINGKFSHNINEFTDQQKAGLRAIEINTKQTLETQNED